MYLIFQLAVKRSRIPLYGQIIDGRKNKTNAKITKNLYLSSYPSGIVNGVEDIKGFNTISYLVDFSDLSF